ncbi:thioesterase II family protein [Streptomyces sp. NPDC127119]|uniref:thioesterase II family protein n=1 Tax=Streptomyces sp. NPDC127119 TaxID=3345370 RepID=UPI00363E4565
MDSKWFRRLGPPGPSDPSLPGLVCFPHAGGAASAHSGLARLLAPHLDVLGVQYPGRQDRRLEPPEPDITALAVRIAARLMDGGGGPRFFFGHSMGALVAYETARALRRSGAPGPQRLFLSGRGAPARMPAPHDRLRGDAEILAAVRRLGGTDAAVLDDPDLVDLVLPALRADYLALGSYRWAPEPSLDTPVTVLVGSDDPVAPLDTAKEWSEHTAGESETLVFPGGHFYLNSQLDQVAAVIVERVAARPIS